MPPLWVLAVLVVFIFYVKDRIQKRDIYRMENEVPGPKAWPILGNSLDFVSDSAGIFKKMMDFSAHYGRFFRLWNNGNLYVICSDVRDIEVILTDTKNITKADNYRYIIAWTGYGVLTSSGQKWKSHRKIITPTFFFKILEDFLVVFNKNGKVMCEILEEKVGKGPFNVYDYANRLALDNICETAIGIEFNVQQAQNSKYLKAIKTICETATMRMYKVWLMPDILFKLSPYAKHQNDAIAYVNNLTKDIIKQKREALMKKEKSSDDNDFTYGKKMKAFLDLMLEDAGSQLTDQEIIEEVNTFMFAGHDTASSGISFALYEIAANPDVQEKLYNEQMQVLDSVDENVTIRHFAEMRYLEQVIKETLRMYSLISLAGRKLDTDLQLPNGPCLPKGTNMIIDFYTLHRDPKVFPNPNQFNPDNFADTGNKRHPYAYIPFSAGPRNCIGQKFGMMEIKATVSHVVRNYKLTVSKNPEHKLKLASEIVLMSKTGQIIEIEKRV